MNYELVIFVIFCQLCCIVKFDMFTDRILDFDRYQCIFRTKLSFSISILFPIKKYENGNGFSVYRPFPTVFIPSYYYTNNTVAEQVLPISNQIHKQCKNCGTTHAQFSCITSTVTNSVKYLWAKYNTYTHSANYCKASLYHKDYSVPQYLRTQTHPSNYFITSTKEHHTYP
jgi:hypothetical protein